MHDPRRFTDAISEHPRLDALADTARERAHLTSFAQDLAAWLCGVPADELGALTRVVTRIARRELRGTRSLTRERPALAVEAAAKAAELLWPFLKERALAEPAPPPEPPEVHDVVEGEEDSGDPDDEGDEHGARGAGGEQPDPEAEPEGASGEDDGQGEGDGDGDEAEDGEAEDGEADADGEEHSPGDEGPELELSEAEADDDSDSEGEEDGDSEHEPDADADDADTDDEGDSEVDDDSGSDADGTPAPDDPVLPPLAGALDQAALDADRALSHLSRFFPGAGWSLAPGAVQSLSLSRLPAFVSLIERLPELDRIADALGRLEQAERASGADAGGSEEVTGVHFGGEVAHALPSELGLLADADTEDLFYSRWAERRLVSLELSGAGLDGAGHGDRRGPIIACLDASASMDGAPELACKALILALCKRVVPAGRTVHVLMFGGRGQRLEIRLDRRPSALNDLLELLTRSFDGGTDFDGPLLRALDLLSERSLERADILVLTDGKAVADPSVVLRVEQAREQLGVRVTSVVIGQGWVEPIRAFSDRVWHLGDARVDGAVGLVQGFSG